MKNENIYPLPLGNNELKQATGATFRFIDNYRGKMGLKHSDYKPAQIYRGKKWYVFYSYRNPETQKFERIRVYEDINRLKNEDRENYAQLLKNAVNFGLSKGYNPFEKEELKVAVKNWSLVQGLNYFKQNLGSRGTRKRTQELYGSILKFLYEYLAPLLNEDINKITKNHLLSAFRAAQLKRKWTNSTYNNYITFVRTIFNSLKNEDIIKENPCKIKPLPEKFERHKYFSKEIFQKIIDNADPEFLDFFMFCYHTAVRPNEARQITDEDFWIDRKTLHIKADVSKTGKERFVPMTDYVIKNYSHRKGKLFDVPEKHFSRKFSRLRKKLKLSREYTLYSVKPTRAIHLVEDGASIYFIMQLFGHSNPMTTMAYLRDIGESVDYSQVEKGIKF